MAGAPLNWFLALTTILQLVVAIRLAYETELWVRLVALLCALNGLLIPADLVSDWAGVGDLALLLDGVTGSLLVLVALAFPTRSRAFRAWAIALGSWHVAVGAAFAVGFVGREAFTIAYQAVPIVGGYALFTGAVAIRFADEPGRFPAGTEWIVAAFVIRIAEFPSRYLPRIRPAGFADPSAYFLVGLLVVTAFVAHLALRLASGRGRGPDLRARALVGGAIGLGVLLGLADLLPGAEHAPETEIVRRLSLVLVRPVFLAIGILGAGVAGLLLLPLGAAAVGTGATIGLLAPLFPSTAPGLVTIAGAAMGGVAALVTLRLVPRREPRSQPLSAPGLERWKVLVLALADSDARELDERFARATLARAIGVEVRNLHRLAVDANEAGEAQGRGRLVEWRVARGLNNQQKYYYWLTPAGRDLARALAEPRRASVDRTP